jgi:hypothetical protein
MLQKQMAHVYLCNTLSFQVVHMHAGSADASEPEGARFRMQHTAISKLQQHQHERVENRSLPASGTACCKKPT